MQRHWSSAVIAALVAGTAVLGAQGSPRPANTPPRDAAAPAGVQRTPTAPSAKPRTDRVTITGCLQDSPMIAGAAPLAPGSGRATNAPVAGPAAGTTGATPAEKAAERAGNVPDPHESAPSGQRGTAVPGGDRAAADTRTGRTAPTAGRDGAATANTPAVERGGHVVYYLNNATMKADGERDSDTPIGTSGLKTTGYRLEGDSATIAAHLNQQVRIEGTIQANLVGAGAPAAPGAAAGPILRVESVTMVAEKCDVK